MWPGSNGCGSSPRRCKRRSPRHIGRGHHMYTASKASLGALALVLAGVAMAQGQGVNGSIQATAQVQTPTTVTGTQTLAFGNVFPGIAKAVAYRHATDAGPLR